MKLVSFLRGQRASFGCVEAGEVLDFGASAPVGATLRDYLPLGLPVWKALAGAVTPKDRIALREVTLLAPVPNARKFLALGGNYESHLAEAKRVGIVRTSAQVWFNKQVTCINGPYADIEHPSISEQLDYEGEFGVVVGRDCRNVAAADAGSAIAGYVVCNDISVRDWQMRSPTHTLGKSFDTHGPFGPWIVTADEIPDPHALRLETFVNGELRQSAITAEMIHKIPAMIEELSTAFTLQAGDVLSTGSPAGVGGLFDPPRYLQAGDVVRVEVERIGHIENRVVESHR
jgi:2-keto-4-pentenoate hydratase/2-oxohepta-3-ene-1,7-dioic acid hydratase in catechol pathway